MDGGATAQSDSRQGSGHLGPWLWDSEHLRLWDGAKLIIKIGLYPPLVGRPLLCHPESKGRAESFEIPAERFLVLVRAEKSLCGINEICRICRL